MLISLFKYIYFFTEGTVLAAASSLVEQFTTLPSMHLAICHVLRCVFLLLLVQSCCGFS